MQQCPACDYELTMAEQTTGEGKCPSCGVYFAKYHARMQREAGGPAAADDLPPSPPARPVTSVAKSAQDFRGLPIRGPVPVVVTDIEMRFGSMVVFMVKWALAAIPAMMILTALAAVLFVMIGTMFSSAQAQQIYRCTDANGQTIFSQQACPDGGAGEKVQAHNAPPSNGAEVIPWANPPESPSRTRATTQVTVVGAPKKCSSISDQEIRSAIIWEKVLVGMSTDQAIKSWGRPVKINRSSSGPDQWVYPNYQYLYIEDGCVVSWN